jgi:FkbM family methyltransferase
MSRTPATLVLARAVLAPLRHTPKSTQAAVKQGLEPVGRLDHPRHDVRMAVENDVSLFRLGSCAKEPETVTWIEDTFRPGDVLYDVGANVGAYSLLAYRHAGGDARVFAFEPVYSTYAALARNVVLNTAEGGVVPMNVALADTTGLVPMSFSSVRGGAAMHTFGERTGDAETWQPVVAFRLDDLIEQFELPAPTHLKLDVDGAELSMLRGAPRTLDDPALRTVLVEVTETEAMAADVLAELDRHGFAVASRHLHGRSGVTNVILERR